MSSTVAMSGALEKCGELLAIADAGRCALSAISSCLGRAQIAAPSEHTVHRGIAFSYRRVPPRMPSPFRTGTKVSRPSLQRTFFNPPVFDRYAAEAAVLGSFMRLDRCSLGFRRAFPPRFCAASRTHAPPGHRAIWETAWESESG
jgi:hypothetical protein